MSGPLKQLGLIRLGFSRETISNPLPVLTLLLSEIGVFASLLCVEFE